MKSNCSRLLRHIVSIVGIILSLHSSLVAWPWEKQPEAGSVSKQDPSVGEANRHSYTRTFLDTLNKGHELGISSADPEAPSPRVIDNRSDKSTVSGLTSAFRIQCIASSQIEMIRTEKKSLESRTRWPLYIVSSPPYYKLLVGDFADRSDAERALPELRSLGYADAWIVAASPVQKP